MRSALVTSPAKSLGTMLYPMALSTGLLEFGRRIEWGFGYGGRTRVCEAAKPGRGSARLSKAPDHRGWEVVVCDLMHGRMGDEAVAGSSSR